MKIAEYSVAILVGLGACSLFPIAAAAKGIDKGAIWPACRRHGGCRFRLTNAGGMEVENPTYGDTVTAIRTPDPDR